jgi:hypothetical protein
MLRRIVLLSCVLVAACHRQPQHPQEDRITDPKKLAVLREAYTPEAYLRPEDQAKAAKLRSGFSAPIPCAYDAVELGTPVIKSLPTDQCFKMTKPQEWKGLWRNDFEGSRFCPEPARECTDQTKGDPIWLTFPKPPENEMQGRGGLYVVDIIGRRTLYPGMQGHMGMSKYEMIVDRVISMKEVEPPPPEPTKAEMIAHFRKCEAERTCVPDWGAINAMTE